RPAPSAGGGSQPAPSVGADSRLGPSADAGSRPAPFADVEPRLARSWRILLGSAPRPASTGWPPRPIRSSEVSHSRVFSLVMRRVGSDRPSLFSALPRESYTGTRPLYRIVNIAMTSSHQ